MLHTHARLVRQGPDDVISKIKTRFLSAGKTIEEDAAVYDLILLSELTEAAVIANTKALYYENIIYSYVGKWYRLLGSRRGLAPPASPATHLPPEP